MRLSHITIVGFKSFAKKVDIDVTHNITGVVGPNGSGKSNVAEAIRFVLGEQSMKSMRGKLGADLIFKGSNHLPPMSRASVTMTIDNKSKIDTSHASSELAPYLAYEKLVLSRIIYADGTSDYTLNDAKVRLKDVQELLAFSGIGTSAHTIINQGEADKILLAQPRERKEAIEDALGLRVYHLRLNESNRKLEKTKTHLREVELLRKEIAPHLMHLKKQVEKIESKEKERVILQGLLTAYLQREEISLQEMKKKMDESGSVASLNLISESIKKELSEKSKPTPVFISSSNKIELQKEMRELILERDKIAKNLGRYEAERAYLEKELNRNSDISTVNIDIASLNNTESKLTDSFSTLKDYVKKDDKESSLSEIENSQNLTQEFFSKYKTFAGGNIEENKKDNLEKALFDLQDKIVELEKEEKNLSDRTVVLQEKIDEADNAFRKNIEGVHEEEKKSLLLGAKLREFESVIALRSQEEQEYSIRKERFESLMNEGALIVGRVLLSYKEVSISEELEKMNMSDLLRAIDKSKFRIEDAGVSNSAEVMEEYRSVTERDEYLRKEMEDIRQTEEKLMILIVDLEKSLEERFKNGVEEISKLFTQFFAEVFPGGKASLFVVPIIKLDENGEEVKENGIDIDVSLPSKKVKEINMFSGGERALVSIALLFAMSSLTPPPFMVLDETDAPLDESNARKYGAMLARLAEKSKLLVITHNRETMNHCEMLYGVTLGAEGASKLLSIDLAEKQETM